jgi:oxygen-independent coproporphyrinogen-3 oxidase
VRWWNIKHLNVRVQTRGDAMSPAQAREVLSAEQRRVERIMLELRLADGLSTSLLTRTERDRVGDLLVRQLAVLTNGTLILTARGRLLADGVIRDLLD